MSKDFFKISILPYAAIIIKICRAYTNTQEDFEDYYQEVCLQIWRSRKNFDHNSQWSTWVYRITLNVCLTLQKKKKVITSPLESSVKTLAEEKNDSDHSEIDKLYSGIKQLSKIDRAVILLYLEEKTYQEIATILETSPSNIGVRINRIKKKLKTLLNG
ncbi:MAG: RNA polymerase sigma factor [Bacteroidota bacterium]